MSPRTISRRKAATNNLEAEQHGGGRRFSATASDVTLRHARVLGASGGSWPVRFAGAAGVARPQDPTYATGNSVKDLILHDAAPGKDDGLDFSFQENGSISDVQHMVRVSSYTSTATFKTSSAATQ